MDPGSAAHRLRVARRPGRENLFHTSSFIGSAALARLAYEVPPRILITGSLYLAGHVLGLNGTPPG
jgi:folylpolyglutamate synthase/dihydropteroate synthase